MTHTLGGQRSHRSSPCSAPNSPGGSTLGSLGFTEEGTDADWRGHRVTSAGTHSDIEPHFSAMTGLACPPATFHRRTRDLRKPLSWGAASPRPRSWQTVSTRAVFPQVKPQSTCQFCSDSHGPRCPEPTLSSLLTGKVASHCKPGQKPVLSP